MGSGSEPSAESIGPGIPLLNRTVTGHLSTRVILHPLLASRRDSKLPNNEARQTADPFRLKQSSRIRKQSVSYVSGKV
ncbi:hypothetical protein HPP92_013618 [Vanilla planifolia]|uniref:Uncharacterized protein n=1 Tax=Vanilla planifolia TaxID=51239 RepID=A0A835UWW5_VANPL|nr:hypothetical protein HPP92_013618 [Vanilla planifolia]